MVSAPMVRISRPVRPCAARTRRAARRRGARVREVGVAVAADGDAPRAGRREADHDAHRGGLAGAVRAEEAGDPAGLGDEGHVVDGQGPPYVLVTPSTVIMREPSRTAPRIGPRDRHRDQSRGRRDSGICSAASATRRVRRVHGRRPDQYNPPLTWRAQRGAPRACCVQRGVVVAVGAHAVEAGAVAVLARPVARTRGPGAVVLPAALAVRGRGDHHLAGLGLGDRQRPGHPREGLSGHPQGDLADRGGAAAGRPSISIPLVQPSPTNDPVGSTSSWGCSPPSRCSRAACTSAPAVSCCGRCATGPSARRLSRRCGSNRAG